ncbi:hypothetical protein [Demequina litorisediminis]|uniref:Uncharacterized protein n=1 Tax=Demequina litorisediminis TaxID=1849022 RepID=A0ABQ6IDF9_9MICO|nr:hypothetical protein GCM10025876_15890 [Demequina litorisediminis]
MDDLYEQCSDHITEYIARLRGGGTAAKKADDLLVLVGLEAQLRERHLLVRGGRGVVHGVEVLVTSVGHVIP